ncbi:MAG: hypothetical protein MZU84_07510 [Sphingobacterium sp.]|nr:hypothetical protein [Sphingobacterium sp.]
MEAKKQQDYNLKLGSFNLTWFIDEVRSLYQAMVLKQNANPDAQAMYKRLLNYLSLASNMGANSALKANDYDLMMDYLTLYEKVDPANKDMYYLYAVLYASKGNAELMHRYLESTVSFGFDDKKRLSTDQAFSPYINEVHFQRILSSIKEKLLMIAKV